MYNLTKQS